MKKFIFLVATIFGLFIIITPAFACDYTKGQITSISPSTSVTVGDILTVSGSGFGTIQQFMTSPGNSIFDRGINVFFNDSTSPGDSSVRGRDGGTFGGGLNGGIDNFLSWSDTKIEIKIPSNFEQGGAKNALNDGINKFSLYIVVNSYKQTGALSDGTKIYSWDNAYEICGQPDNGANSSFTYQPSCSADTWTCGDWGSCKANGKQIRTCNKNLDCQFADTPSPATSQSCTFTPPTCTSWTYSDWSACSQGSTQTRTITSSFPEDCSGGNPVLTQSCSYIPPCTTNDYSCSDWSVCSTSGRQTRICNKTTNCQDSASSPATTQSCTYTPPCAYFYYSNWSVCSSEGQQTRSITSKYPSNCEGGVSPQTTQSCTPPCTADTWSCGDWNSCSASGIQTRTCTKTYDCLTAYTQSPATSQSCTPQCTADTWTCGTWGSCSPQGIQTRSCNKTYDCLSAETATPATTQSCTPPQPTCTADTWTCNTWSACSLSGIQSRSCTKTYDCLIVETAPPITNQFCEAPNKPQPMQPSETDEISNQSTIIKSTVKLLCPVDSRKASQGSGTIIDSTGTILTNKHVIAGTLGCLVGFIDNYDDEPYFGERQIADISKVSLSQDIAILKIRNPKNIRLASVDITKSSSNLSLGTQITTYGYPAKFGTKVTYTSGDFSGTDGNYLKTTAILEYGNSGGGAYLKNGTFVGIPSAVVKGELNALGYILSINTIQAWLDNSSVVLGTTDNSYSRVSFLEDIDLNKLDSLKLFIPNTDEKGDLIPTPTKQNQQEPIEQPEQPQITEQQNEPQDESVVIESSNTNQEAAEQSTTSTPEQSKPKISWLKQLFLWLGNLFNKLATK